MNSRHPLKLEEKRQEGFTLIEMMIGIMVFSIGILSIFTMLGSAVKTNNTARGVTEQSAMAESLVERLMPLPYNHADLAPGSHPATQEGRYTISWTVAQNAMIDNTKTITATVTWPGGGQQKTVNLIAIKNIY